MRLSEFKNSLVKQELLTFKLPNGTKIPSHFHVTEVGLITREFIDCGGLLAAPLMKPLANTVLPTPRCLRSFRTINGK